MLEFESLTIRNFMSIGQNTQTMTFDTNNLTLVLGENLDTADDTNIGRNGVGKSTLNVALCYVLFDTSINNDIKKNNLVNNINDKEMLVTVTFKKDGNKYTIERGRKPNVLRFYINDKKFDTHEDDEAQGENRHTQEEIERVLGFSHNIFKHIVTLNTLVEPFLSLGQAKQREFIEELLGIDQLSKKAEILKKDIIDIKTEIKAEEVRIQAARENNTRIEATIRELETNKTLWDSSHTAKLESLNIKLSELKKIDIELEIENHKKVQEFNEINKLLDSLERNTESVQSRLEKLQVIDIDKEIERHKFDKEWAIVKSALNKINVDKSRIKSSIGRHTSSLQALESQIHITEGHKCPTCAQAVHDESYHKIVDDLNRKVADMKKHIGDYEYELNNVVQEEEEYVEVEVELLKTKPDIEKLHYKTIEEAYDHKNNISVLENEYNGLIKQLQECIEVLNSLGDKPETIYTSIDDAYDHKNKISVYSHQINNLQSEINPYNGQINSLKESGLVEVSFELINELTKLREHQEFLYKLLTNKDSFIRKKIIDQNLAYLNAQLQIYLDKLGLPHTVKFMNDLSVEIEHMGRDLDFGNLSRGERTRLILGLSWAFRDIFELLNYPINVVLVDEILDLGLDMSGIDKAYSVLRDMARNNAKDVLIVSHREELISKISNVLKVVKEGGFTTLEYVSEYAR